MVKGGTQGARLLQEEEKMKLPAKAAIIEVLLRDGLQNEARPVPLPVKIDCLHKLPGAGLREIEIGAFVDPRRVPQMPGT